MCYKCMNKSRRTLHQGLAFDDGHGQPFCRTGLAPPLSHHSPSTGPWRPCDQRLKPMHYRFAHSSNWLMARRSSANRPLYCSIKVLISAPQERFQLVHDSDTDEELSRALGDWSEMLPGSVGDRRFRQLSRWHRGVNDYIRQRIVRTRQWWADLILRLWWGREGRRRKLLRVLRATSRMRSVLAVSNFECRHWQRLATRLPLPAQYCIQQLVG